MYYVITVKDGLITGRHENTNPITSETFPEGSAFRENQIINIEPESGYEAGFFLGEYDASGALRPLIERIQEGLRMVPPGYELIDGELVEVSAPVEDAPPSILNRIMQAENAYADEAKAARVLFKALAKADVITPEQAIDNRTMFDQWSDRIGTAAEQGEYLHYEDGLYRVKQGHLIQAHYPPSIHTASLYTRVQEPGAGPEPWQPGQSYASGVEVTHNGYIWESMVNNNTWEPGAPGAYNNIWRKVI